MVRIGTFLVILEPVVQGRQTMRVDINDIADAQEVVPEQTLELKRDFPICLAEKFGQAVQLRLRKEVARLNFDIYVRRTWETSPVTEVLNLVTSLVFVEVKDDLVDVWRYTSVGRAQRANAFAISLPCIGVTIEVFLLEEGRTM